MWPYKRIFMKTEEIFKNIALHMLKGIMIHEEMANCFAFLNLKRYEIMQEERYLDESKELSKVNSFYISQYGKLIPKILVAEFPKIIPDVFYNHTVDDLTSNNIRQSVKDLFNAWVKWETETKELYEQCYIDLIDNNSDVSASIIIEKMLVDVNSELEVAKKFWYKLKSCDFDIVFILEDQDRND